jgi:hypothetical protein
MWICAEGVSMLVVTNFQINIYKLKMICPYLELYQYLYRKDSHASQNFT